MTIDVGLFGVILTGFGTLGASVLAIWNKHSNSIAVLQSEVNRMNDHIENLYKGDKETVDRVRMIEDKHNESMIRIEQRLGEIQTSIEKKLK